jgi:hypothetical protein
LLLVSGGILLLISTALFGYASYSENEVRSKARVPYGIDYGFIPFDLLRGRTHFEKRENGRVVFSLDFDPLAEGRIAIARAAFGIGVVGASLLVLMVVLGGEQKGRACRAVDHAAASDQAGA